MRNVCLINKKKIIVKILLGQEKTLQRKRSLCHQMNGTDYVECKLFVSLFS